MTLIARTHVRQGLIAKGHRLLDAIHLASSVDDETIDTAISASPDNVKVEATKVAAIGDGTILAAIKQFFASDLGKALIALIMSLIVVG